MFAGQTFYRAVGETGLYVACAVVFVVFSGLLLHRLIIGPGSLSRFYKVFTLAFLAYAVAWTIGWMTLRGNIGSVVGLLAGTAAMGVLLAQAFAAGDATWKIIAALFVGNALGYFAGGWAHNAVLVLEETDMLGIVLDRPAWVTLSKAIWGLCYGLGFGAGIGFAFYGCQAGARRLIATLQSSHDAIVK